MARQYGSRQSGRSECTICRHPGLVEINAMLLNGASYPDLISRMKQLHPTIPELTKWSLGRHKAKHLLNQPITVEDEDGNKTVYVTGVIRSESLQVPKNAIPQQQVTVDQALDVIITAGILSVLNDPGIVGMKTLVDALVLKDKRSGKDDEHKDFEDAWMAPEFQQKKDELKAEVEKKRKLIRRKQVTYSEETQEDIEDGASRQVPIDVTPVEVEAKLLEVSDGDESADFASVYIPKPTAVPVSRIERHPDMSRSEKD